MDLAEYYALLAPLPRPTAEQVERFARHVARAHSWYKHLAFTGAEFVVFIDPSAGGAFTEDQPRIHHTWQTRRDYIEQFGHLSYMYRHSPTDPFDTDYVLNARVDVRDGVGHLVDQHATPVLELPEAMLRDCGFTLYPFACDNDVFLFRFAGALRALAQGRLQHPCAQLLIEYHRAATRNRRALDKFVNESRRRHAAGIPCRAELDGPVEGDVGDVQYWLAELRFIRTLAETPDALSELERDYVESERDTDVLRSRLEAHELAKIKRALEILQKHFDAATSTAAQN